MNRAETRGASPLQAATAPNRESFCFISGFRSLVTHGCQLRVTCPAVDGDNPQGQFQQQIRTAFSRARQSGVSAPVLVGAIPFDTRQPSALFIPQETQFVSRNNFPLTAQSGKGLALSRRTEIPAQASFMAMVSQAALATRGPEVDKVVLSRLVDIHCHNMPDSQKLLADLARQNPTSFNFHLPLADGGTLIGASPELMLRKEGQAFCSLPLAGSARREPDAEQDRVMREALMHSRKDRHEHEVVVQAIKQLLVDRATRLLVPDSPSLVSTSTLWHLATAIEGEQRDGRDNALSLACLLHPTPALSGYPHHKACELIATLEPFKRDLFGGIVGWMDENGNGEWVVVIRSARLMGQNIRLFAGAGIVPDSSPESEWHETGVKLTTMLNVFGLN